jgi:phosphoenolpyruvate carboxykinase (GTP)
VPPPSALDTRGLDVTPEVLEDLLTVDPEDWIDPVEQQHDYLVTFGSRMPAEIWEQHEEMARRVKAACPGRGKHRV